MAWPNTVRKDDLRIEFYRGSGPGGQHRNKTSSACRITHKITGISAQCEDERCQHKNKKIAFRRLAAKLVPLMKKEVEGEQQKIRPTEVIRTYHQVRGTVKDKRIDKIFKYDEILDGNLESLIKEICRIK